jgi:mRNA interferase RelE/StbE
MSGVARFRIQLSRTGFACLKAIKDKKVRGTIARSIDALASNPVLQGKALTGPLEGLRSIRAARDRYRIIYRVHDRRRLVSILWISPRRPGQQQDVYAIARRLLKTLLGEEE